jgi:hypothetical protein
MGRGEVQVWMTVPAAEVMHEIGVVGLEVVD